MSPTKQDFISIDSSQHEDHDDEVDDMIELKFINNEAHYHNHHQIVQMTTESIDDANHTHPDAEQQYRKQRYLLHNIHFLQYFLFLIFSRYI